MKREITVTVNGEQHHSLVEPRMLLVHYLREELDLTGTHIGCDTSQCGACVVHLNGEAVKACTVLAVQADGSNITTIEGMSTNGKLHPLQEGFWEMHGLQCGFCTPGMIMAAYDLLKHNPNPTEKEIRAALQGNICRCTGYQNIVKAIQYAIQKMQPDQRVLVTAGRGEGIAQASTQEEDTEFLSVNIWDNPDVSDIINSANAFIQRQKILNSEFSKRVKQDIDKFSGGDSATNIDQSPFKLPLDPSISKTKEQWLAEGKAHHTAKRYRQAVAAFDEAIIKDPDYGAAYFEKALALDKLGYRDEVVKALSKAKELGHYR